MITARIAEDEYRFALDGDGDRFRATNRANGFRSWLDWEGVEIESRVEPGLPKWSYRFTSIGRPGRLGEVPRVAPELGRCGIESRAGADGTCLRRLEYSYPGVLEYYENDRSGLEQGFVVDEAPEGEGPLVLAGVVEGELAGHVDATVHFRTAP